jgi:hypothetical protein
MEKTIKVILLTFLFQSQELKFNFSPEEVESMLFLYNQTTIKGSDVDVVAPLGAKLKKGLQQARMMKDSTGLIPMSMTPVEIQICLNIIENSQFEAKYAELVAGMKRKLTSLLPTPPPAAEKQGDK